MKSSNNEVTHGLRGKMRLLVFKRWYGKTIVSTFSERDQSEPTSAQAAVQATFKLAAAYAKGAIADPATKQAYKAKAKGAQKPYNLALADFFTAPVIGEIESGNYNGQVGDNVRVAVTDDFKVASVQVKIEKADGTLIEQGSAVVHADGLHWIYAATVANSNIAGTKITVTATDLPGNLVSKQKSI
jgi:hypothetical protein